MLNGLKKVICIKYYEKRNINNNLISSVLWSITQRCKITNCVIFYFNKFKVQNFPAMREHQNTYFFKEHLNRKASLEITSLLKDNFIPKLYSIQNTLKLKISSDKKLELISKEIETMLAAKGRKNFFQIHTKS